MKRLISIGLALIMCLGMVSTLFVTSGAEGTAPTLKIKACNLSFENSVAIKYAVESSVENVKLLIWTKPMEDYVLGTQAKEIVSSGVSDEEEVKGCYIFDYTDLVAKQMTDVVYARAYAEVDGVVYYSDLVKYSILEYAYRKLGKIGSDPTTDANLKEMLSAMLEYGAGAQKYLDYSADRLATANWVLVVLAAGLIDDGSAHGLYLPGDTVALTAPASNAAGKSFSYWKDHTGEVVATTASFELTVGETNTAYVPVYGEPVPSPYSEGLAFYIDSRGEAYVSIGTCTDTDIRIPPTTPDGAKVVGADRRGFENETKIKSVSFPATITFIDSDAFYGCTALTDVYYDGTEEQWNTTVRIYAGNTAIENATKHFTGVATETFTVTFVDFDGTVLKTETVESGKSATAPADPTRTGYAFAGWDAAFDNITGDLTVTATYTLNVTAPTVVVHDAVANVGDTTIDVVISIENNPGIASMRFYVHYDEALTVTSHTHNSAFGSYVTTAKPYGNPLRVNYVSPLADNATSGDFITLTFALSEAIAEDTVLDDITIELVTDQIYATGGENGTEKVPVTFSSLAGKILVQK